MDARVCEKCILGVVCVREIIVCEMDGHVVCGIDARSAVCVVCI